MTRGHRPTGRVCPVSLAIVIFLLAVPALPSGFQVMTQGAKATGMGLAFTAVADDPSAIFYNPAGLGWQKHFSAQISSTLLSKVEAEFEGQNPFPGAGTSEEGHETTYFVPGVYAIVPLTATVNFGFGVFAPYGLGNRWDNAETFSGRFVAQNAFISSSDLNPVLSWQASPSFAVAVGADYRISKVTLEQNSGRINPFTQSFVDVAHVKLDSELVDNTGWGWNVGFLWKPIPLLSLGASYRSSIEVDYEGEAKFTQRPTGNAAFDMAVAAGLPQGDQDVATTIEFPSSANFGAAINLPGELTVSLEADWTEWETFSSLVVNFENAAIPDLVRTTDWENSWAYRVGLQKKWGGFAVRAGYYRDNTPQPVEDIGPILADSDRDAYSLGIGYDTERWGVDLSDLYLKFKERETEAVNHDNFFGRYKEAANIFALSLRLSF